MNAVVTIRNAGMLNLKKNSDLHDPDADELSASLVEFS